MPAGRPHAAHSQRFARAIPRRVGGIYLAEFGNGIIKVGQSANVRTRLIGLNHICRAHGHEIIRFAAFLGGDTSEQACIDAIAAKAPAAPGHVEYFHSISFDDALALVLPIVTPVATSIAISEAV